MLILYFPIIGLAVSVTLDTVMLVAFAETKHPAKFVCWQLLYLFTGFIVQHCLKMETTLIYYSDSSHTMIITDSYWGRAWHY